ncbi:MAG TPA: hypothetical protein PLC98_09060 [Anaerolineales bacterium]|nr:hypothetical protein [Anaerolineales bacterium]
MWIDVLENGVFFGGLITAWMIVVVIGSLRWNPEIWVHDAPPEMRAALPPKSDLARRQTTWVAAVMFAGLAALLIGQIVELNTRLRGSPGFLPIFVAIWLGLQTFNLIDLVLIDWLLIETIRPSWATLPGAEAFAERRFYGFHFRGFLKGFVGITIAAGAIAALATGVMALL